MLEQFVQAIVAQLEQPKQDLHQNMKALVEEWVKKLDLVTNEEFALQQIKLQQAQQALEDLKQRLALLESKVS